jgi:hypothetical protein
MTILKQQMMQTSERNAWLPYSTSDILTKLWTSLSYFAVDAVF